MTTLARPPASRPQHVPSAVLGLLGNHGPCSRTDMARLLQVSPATITAATRGLLEQGLITELSTRPTGVGRPARLLGLTDDGSGALGVKVTTDHLTVVHVGLDCTVRESWTEPFDVTSPDAVDQLGRSLAAHLVQRPQVVGVGIGLPGSVDDEDSGVVTAPVLGWVGVPVGASLRRRLDVSVRVENDVNALAVAERLFGQSRGHASSMVVTIGRGIGCGLVLDGQILRGAGGGAGEIGHIPVADGEAPCDCGSRGCLEAYVGDAALLRRAAALGVVGPGAQPADLRVAADAGDEAAREVYRAAGELLGRTLAGVVQTVDPEIVILLGEGTAAWSHWEPGFEPALRRHLMPGRRGVPYVVEPWTDEQWAQGAASLVLVRPFDAEDVAAADPDAGTQAGVAR